MKIAEVKEWIFLAENDLYSAKVLFSQSRKPLEVISYLCSQSAEKYLKGYLVYNDKIPPKTHNLISLLNLCEEIDSSFKEIETECGYLNNFNNEIRYPMKIELQEIDVKIAIKRLEKIQNFKIIELMTSSIQ